MKLEVGMYVRGKYYSYRGKIGKIIKNYNNDLEIAYANGVLKTTVGSFLEDNTDINGRQYIASFNIIDLIEVGDYVNGFQVYDIDRECCRITLNGGEYGDEFRLTYLRPALGKNMGIKSIVTKEQFKQMEYIVE